MLHRRWLHRLAAGAALIALTGMLCAPMSAQNVEKKTGVKKEMCACGHVKGTCAACQKAAQTARSGKKSVRTADKNSLTMRLSGLHCEGCAQTVKDSLMTVTGVRAVNVNPKTQIAVVSFAGAPPKSEVLTEAVKKVGYKVLKVEKTR
jgi:copper chaperone CopZ